MTITVKNLVGRSKVLAGSSGLDREVTSPQVLSPELSSISTVKGMAASLVHLPPSQSAFLCSLPKLERTRLVRTLMRQRPAGLVLTGGISCPELLAGADHAGVPVFMSRDLQKLARLLSRKLMQRVWIQQARLPIGWHGSKEQQPSWQCLKLCLLPNLVRKSRSV